MKTVKLYVMPYTGYITNDGYKMAEQAEQSLRSNFKEAKTSGHFTSGRYNRTIVQMAGVNYCGKLVIHRRTIKTIEMELFDESRPLPNGVTTSTNAKPVKPKGICKNCGCIDERGNMIYDDKSKNWFCNKECRDEWYKDYEDMFEDE